MTSAVVTPTVVSVAWSRFLNRVRKDCGLLMAASAVFSAAWADWEPNPAGLRTALVMGLTASWTICMVLQVVNGNSQHFYMCFHSRWLHAAALVDYLSELANNLAIVYNVRSYTFKHLSVWLQWLQCLHRRRCCIHTLYPADDGARSATHIGKSVLRSGSGLAERRPGGAGDAGQALLCLGGGVLCCLLGRGCALGRSLGGAGGGGSGTALDDNTRLPEGQPGQDGGRHCGLGCSDGMRCRRSALGGARLDEIERR
jgi:hypothetical protein